MLAIHIDRFGGPEVLTPRETPEPALEPGHALVRVARAGVNFIDVYHRTGRYPGQLPFIPGVEGSGVVIAFADDSSVVSVGQRVAWAFHPGGYAEVASIPIEKLVPVPDGVGDDQAAAAMLQGLTAHYLTSSTWPVQPGDIVVVHAAAGGAGGMIVQMAKRRGARVIGTTSTEEKARVIREAGADHTILYDEVDFAEVVNELTGGLGADVIYDSVGQDTFLKGFECLRNRGMLVLFGASSGAPAPIDPMVLSKGSFYLTRPTIAHHIEDRASLLSRAGEVFASIDEGSVRVRIGGIYPLAESARAHHDLESRSTTGKLLLDPGTVS